jgi:hypothetical protein
LGNINEATLFPQNHHGVIYLRHQKAGERFTKHALDVFDQDSPEKNFSHRDALTLIKEQHGKLVGVSSSRKDEGTTSSTSLQLVLEAARFSIGGKFAWLFLLSSFGFLPNLLNTSSRTLELFNSKSKAGGFAQGSTPTNTKLPQPPHFNAGNLLAFICSHLACALSAISVCATASAMQLSFAAGIQYFGKLFSQAYTTPRPTLESWEPKLFWSSIAPTSSHFSMKDDFRLYGTYVMRSSGITISNFPKPISRHESLCFQLKSLLITLQICEISSPPEHFEVSASKAIFRRFQDPEIVPESAISTSLELKTSNWSYHIVRHTHGMDSGELLLLFGDESANQQLLSLFFGKSLDIALISDDTLAAIAEKLLDLFTSKLSHNVQGTKAQLLAALDSPESELRPNSPSSSDDSEIDFQTISSFSSVLTSILDDDSCFTYADVEPMPLEHHQANNACMYVYMFKPPATISLWQLLALLCFGKRFSMDVTGDGPLLPSCFLLTTESKEGVRQLRMDHLVFSTDCQQPDRRSSRDRLPLLPTFFFHEDQPYFAFFITISGKKAFMGKGLAMLPLQHFWGEDRAVNLPPCREATTANSALSDLINALSNENFTLRFLNRWLRSEAATYFDIGSAGLVDVLRGGPWGEFDLHSIANAFSGASADVFFQQPTYISLLTKQAKGRSLALMTGSEDMSGTQACADSGATQHYVPSSLFFEERCIPGTLRNCFISVDTAGHQAPLIAKKMGDFIISDPQFSEPIILRGVLLVNGLRRPLISIASLATEGYVVIFSGTGCTFLTPTANKPCLRLDRQTEQGLAPLYEFDVSYFQSPSKAGQHHANLAETYMGPEPNITWHKRLGHISTSTIDKTMPDFLPKSKGPCPCDHCVMAQIH